MKLKFYKREKLKVKELNELEQQIQKNKHDYENVKKIGKASLWEDEHFLDANYPRFLNYVNDFLSKFQDGDLTDFDDSVTANELVILNGNEAYSRQTLVEHEDGVQYCVVATQSLRNIILTRNMPNREFIIDMLNVNPSILLFNHAAFKDEYLSAFVNYFDKVKLFLDAPNSIDDRVFDFHPLFYHILCENFDEYFKISPNYEYKECNGEYLDLSALGEMLLEISEKVAKKLNEE